MRLHRHLVKEVCETLKVIFAENVYADKAIERCFRQHKKWGARDRRFFAETVYELVRWWRYYWAILEHQYDLKEDISVIGMYRLFSCWWLAKGNTLPDWEELSEFSKWTKINIHVHDLRELFSQADRESIPQWLDKHGEAELGERWPSILKSMNKPAKVYLRTNQLLITPESLREALAQEGVEAELLLDVPGALVLPERKNVFVTESFKKGLFEVQDAASQMVAPFLQVEPGMRVVDACAGAGGKSLHLAQLMENRGRLICMDIHDRKLGELKKRVRRASVSMSDVRLIDSTKVIKRLHQSADRVLLDVPCSGLGVLRRNPDTKWKLKSSRLEELEQLQWEILCRYSNMVKAGGKLVYATCSILPSENERQVEKFVKAYPQWEIEENLRLDPDQTRFDGFFASRLILK